jgi:hypothetical protein
MKLAPLYAGADKKKLRFKGKRPMPLYYYRESQSLRDPLRFRTRGSTTR